MAEIPDHRKTAHGVIASVWLGELSLPMTYWVFCFLGTVALSALWRHFNDALRLAQTPSTSWMFTGFALMVLTTAYSIWVLVGVWRSSGRYAGPKIWVVLARAVVVIGLFNTVMSIIGFWGLA